MVGKTDKKSTLYLQITGDKTSKACPGLSLCLSSGIRKRGSQEFNGFKFIPGEG